MLSLLAGWLAVASASSVHCLDGVTLSLAQVVGHMARWLSSGRLAGCLFLKPLCQGPASSGRVFEACCAAAGLQWSCSLRLLAARQAR